MCCYLGEAELVPVEVIPVDVVDVGFGEPSGQSETQAPNPATTMSTSGAYTIDFQNLTEDSVGQVYAYYYTNTSVVLGTRSAVYSANVEMAVGLSAIFDEVYVCEAENFPERNDSGISTINVTVKAITRENIVLANSRISTKHTLYTSIACLWFSNIN